LKINDLLKHNNEPYIFNPDNKSLHTSIEILSKKIITIKKLTFEIKHEVENLKKFHNVICEATKNVESCSYLHFLNFNQNLLTPSAHFLTAVTYGINDIEYKYSS